VHLSDEAIAEKMHRCGERFPPNVSELASVGLTPVASSRVAPPRIAEAPVAFECTLWETLETTSRHIFIGKVHRLHARDELIDVETWRVRLQHYFPVGRFGASDYVTTRDRFTLGSASKTSKRGKRGVSHWRRERVWRCCVFLLIATPKTACRRPSEIVEFMNTLSAT
jgi:hypothetical protein